MKEYCNVCWAKLPNGLCFCSKSGRSENCRKERERFAEQKKEAETAKNQKELEGLREKYPFEEATIEGMEA